MREFYSVRNGRNRNLEGFSLDTIKGLFLDLYKEMRDDGFFDEYLGSYCVDQGQMPGLVKSPALDLMLKVRTDGLWPIEDKAQLYNEDDFFDVIEYLFTCVSKPVDGTHHYFNDCGMHWETFNKAEGEKQYVHKINGLLALYTERFELSSEGELLKAAENGFQSIFDADMPTNDTKIKERIDSAILRYRRHGSSIDDRRQAVRDLADVLEYLRPKMKGVLDSKDESDLFNIANNFGIRHHNSSQKTTYDAALWLSWMFYFFLATIHVVLRRSRFQG